MPLPSDGRFFWGVHYSGFQALCLGKHRQRGDPYAFCLTYLPCPEKNYEEAYDITALSVYPLASVQLSLHPLKCFSLMIVMKSS
jgi:hypothetical protein